MLYLFPITTFFPSNFVQVKHTITKSPFYFFRKYFWTGANLSGPRDHDWKYQTNPQKPQSNWKLFFSRNKLNRRGRAKNTITAMASALRSAILRHIRVPATQALSANGSRLTAVRLMSSHDDHITKDEVINRVLDVVKCFPKVDPSKVFFSRSFWFTSYMHLTIWIWSEKSVYKFNQWSICIVDSCLLVNASIRNNWLTGAQPWLGHNMIFTGKLIRI